VEAFIKDLNKAQKEAVVNYKGPSLVIAGAGSGKTRVLMYRIAYILSKGVKPENILALTFTNKAATEMKERIGKMVGEEEAQKLWMGTFHSIFSKILRFEAQATGYSSNYTIYDTVDSRNLLKKIIKEMNLDDKTYKPQAVQGRISSAKNNLLTWKSYNKNTEILKQDEQQKRPKIADIYRVYASRCKQADAMDFDDLLLNINILFRDNPEILKKYQEKFQYILVDEYQDTNFAQYLIVKKLSQKHGNVCVVGDDAQSIYSFRGAKIENILNFQKDYPNYQLFKLEQNYRSTQNIVEAANSMIKKNSKQIPKKVFSEQDKGEKIDVLESYTDKEEAIQIAKTVSDRLDENDYDYQDFAVLYRTNAQSRNFEEAFRQFNIPYKIYGGISFYQRKEIKDLLAYFRLAINHNDEEALLRVINYPTRGIGKTTQDKILNAATANDKTAWEVINNLPGLIPELNTSTANKVTAFVKLIEEFSEIVRETNAYDAAMTIASKSGILKEFENPVNQEEQTKNENLQEILNGIKDFTDSFSSEELPTLQDYIENVSLMTNADMEDEEDINKVTLMTMHSAKGLEFKEVFLAGIEEGLFPSPMSMSTDKELEEERRLFYVALTRAERKATISHAKNRYKWGVSQPTQPSRFINDIAPEYLVLPEYSTSETQEFNESQKSSESKAMPGKAYYGPKRNLKKIESQPSQNKTNNNEQKSSQYEGKFKPGMLVEHNRFGRGKILELENAMPDTKAKIEFQKYGEKQLLLKFAKLKIIS
jgi:DNA helicase-2/ATP-dependent DNA helicase PcrA